MKFCPECGTKLMMENAKFCHECGFRFATTPAPEQPKSTQPKPAQQSSARVIACDSIEEYEYSTLSDGTYRIKKPLDNSKTKYVVPEGVSVIGTDAFGPKNAKKVTEIVLPASIRTLEEKAFYCTKAKKVSIPYGLKNMGEYAFALSDSLTEIELPDTLLEIGPHAFSCCDKLRNVHIPDSVKHIGYCAFLKCTFTEIILPSSLKTIGFMAFSACPNLKNIVLPNGVTELGSGVFSFCDALETLAIPASVSVIKESNIVKASPNLKTITYAGTKAQWNALFNGISGDFKVICSDGII